MKLPGLAACVLLVLGSTGLCRIGETFDQCVVRYGKPLKTTVDNAVFLKNGVSIIISFYEGKADGVGYSKAQFKKFVAEDREKLTDVEIAALLQANAPGPWKKAQAGVMQKAWETEDGSLAATFDPLASSLTVMTRGYTERASAEQETKERQNLKGF